METKQTEVKQNGAPKKAPKKKGANPLRSNKFKRGGMATLMTVVFVAIVVALNVVVSALSERFPSMDIDMTAQRLNTLSDQALEIAQGIDEETTIYLIGAEDAYEDNQIGQSYYSYYGVTLEYNQVASLARRLAEANSNIKVKFVDPDTNPTFISQYPDDNLATGKVMVESARRHRVLGVTDLFSIEQDQTTGANTAYSMVDSALAAALEVVNLEDVPVIAIATGHGEMLNTSNMAGFISLMEDQNFEVQEIDLLTESIPEGTQVLMLPTPTTDYSETEVDKLRGYLNDTAQASPLTLLATANPTQGDMPNYEAFLEEWGLQVEDGVVAESDTSRMAMADATGLLVEPSEDYLSDNTYDRLVSYYSSPISKLFQSNSGISTYDLWVTGDTAYVITEDTTEEDAANPDTSAQTVAAIASKYVQVEGSSVTRSLVMFGSSYVFTDTFVSNAFSDGSFLTDLLLFLTGNDGSNVSVMTESVQTTVVDVMATRSTMDMWGIIFSAVIPVAILACGLVIFLKRRHL